MAWLDGFQEYASEHTFISVSHGAVHPYLQSLGYPLEGLAFLLKAQSFSRPMTSWQVPTQGLKFRVPHALLWLS